MDTQAQQPALTPNTSAFLAYLASTYQSNQNGADALNGNIDPKILPSASYFNLPVPGRDTPEDTPSSKDNSVSPPINGTAPTSDDSDDEGGRRGSGGVSKRKASGSQANHHHEDNEDDDSGSDSNDAHEDKKHEAKKGGRKSKGGVDENGNPVKEMTKAQRRKEQNRQAQKNFRERREAKVKDLETKVAELESKSYGVNVENENLRGILKRLQEENVALKQAAFTFSMPINGSAAQGSANGTSGPSPVQGDDTLRSINEPARQGSLNSKGTPDSLHSLNSPAQANGNSPQPPQLFANGANAFDVSFLTSESGTSPIGQRATPPSVPNPSNSGFTPESSGSSSTKTEIEALWASFLDQQAQQRQQQAQPKTPGTLLKENAYSMFNNNGATNSNSFSMSPKVGNVPTFDKMAFRDDASSSKQAAQAPPLLPTPQTNKQDPWAGMNDDSMRDFLASLSGGNEEAVPAPPEDEDFNAQLLKLLGATSPSAAFNLPVGTDNPFSPTNYLNMESSPVSNPLSPNSQALPSSASNSASPESSAEDARTSTTSLVPSHGDCPVQTGIDINGKEFVYILDQSGNMVKPEVMWNDLGFRKQDAVHQLLIDDLCDLMKSKVSCKDGKQYISQDNAKHVLELRKEYLEMQRHQGGAP